MAYNIAANLNPIDPVGNFLSARQARQQSDQQNMLFEQRQQDRVAQQQAAQAQAEEAKQKAASPLWLKATRQPGNWGRP